MKPIQYLLVGMGVVLIADGIGSIIEYRYQSLLEHSVRVLRTLIGIGIIVIGVSNGKEM